MSNKFSYEFYSSYLSPQKIEEIYQIDLFLEGECWTKEMWTSHLSQGNSIIFLFCNLNRPVGFALFASDPFFEIIDLLKIAVLPEFRRQKIAKKLLVQGVNFFQSYGAKRIMLDVKAENTAAINLYKSLKFNVISKRASYYSDGSDAYSMGLVFVDL